MEEHEGGREAKVVMGEACFVDENGTERGSAKEDERTNNLFQWLNFLLHGGGGSSRERLRRGCDGLRGWATPVVFHDGGSK